MDRITLGTRKVSVAFPGVQALSAVDFEVTTGEIRALVGANGAGKSTLMKVLSGANPSYTGEVYKDGQVVDIRTPLAAKRMGIQIVYQEVDTALVPTFTVAENVMLNETILRGRGVMNWRRINRQAREVLDRLRIKVNVKTLVQNLTLAQKQMVLIARAIQSQCSFLLLDEPTAPLSDTETNELFNLVRHLRETENIAIVFISHRINEVIQICDSYTVMRNGEIVDTTPITASTTSREIVEKMLGRSFSESFPKEETAIGDKVLEVDHLSGADGKVDNVSLYVRSGEIIGIAGLVGAGKSELCKTLFGAYRKTSGSIRLHGRELRLKIPSHAVRGGLALVPEERRKEGVMVSENVAFNLSAASLRKHTIAAFLNRPSINANAKRFVDSLGIVTPSIFQTVKNLSGGNQQKVSVGKWLAADCSVYIFDEPTKGVDVGAKREIFHLINEIAKQGNAVIYASCENAEILSITDRIYVMYDGKVMAELVTKETNEDEIMFHAVGGKHATASAG